MSVAEILKSAARCKDFGKDFAFPSDIENLYELHTLICSGKDLGVADVVVFRWLKILLDLPFNLKGLYSEAFCKFLLQDSTCSACFVANLMKNESSACYEHLKIFGETVNKEFFYAFLVTLSSRVQLLEFGDYNEVNTRKIDSNEQESTKKNLAEKNFERKNSYETKQAECDLEKLNLKTTGDAKSDQVMIKIRDFLEEDSRLIQKIKYKIVSEQGKKRFVDRKACLNALFSLLNRSDSLAFDLALCITTFSFDPEVLYSYFDQDIFCREGLWTNSLLILGNLVYKGTISYDTPILRQIFTDTVFYDNIDRSSDKLRSASLFLIYCISQRAIQNKEESQDLIEYLNKILVPVALFDNDYQCQRAATTILIELQGNGLILPQNFITLNAIFNLRNILTVDISYFDLIADRLYIKIFDNNYEKQITCLEWMKSNQKIVNLKIVAKKNEYFLHELIDLPNRPKNEKLEPKCSYLTALIAYSFMDQEEKLPIEFDNVVYRDPAFVYYVQYLLSKHMFKYFPFHGENEFYETIRVVTFDPNILKKTPHEKFKKIISDENLLFLMKKNCFSDLTMFCCEYFDQDRLIKDLLRYKSQSYFLMNSFNLKFKEKYLEEVEILLGQSEQQKQLALKCLYTLHCVYKNDKNFHQKVTKILNEAVTANLDNYTITEQGDRGFTCRLESYFLLIYLKDRRINEMTVQYLFDRNSTIRDVLIAFLIKLGIFTSFRSFKKLYFHDLESKKSEKICHLMYPKLYHPIVASFNGNTQELVQDPQFNDKITHISDAVPPSLISKSIFDEDVLEFLKKINDDFAIKSSGYFIEDEFYTIAASNSSVLSEKYQFHLAKGVFGHLAVCDGHIFNTLLSWAHSLRNQIEKFFSKDRRCTFLALIAIANFLESENFQISPELIEKVKEVEYKQLEKLKCKIFKLYEQQK